MNIHRLNENRDEENNNPRQGGGGFFGSNNQPLMNGGQNGGQNSNGMSGGLMGQMSGFAGDPRKETFLQMIVINFCPLAAFKSFITYFSIFIAVIFIVQLSVGKRRFSLFIFLVKLTLI